MISGQTLTWPKLCRWPVTILTTIVVPSKKEGVGHLPAEPPGDMNELDETDDGRARERDPLASEHVGSLGFDDLGLAVDHESESTAHGNHRERLE
jgi:hypothetical protein